MINGESSSEKDGVEKSSVNHSLWHRNGQPGSGEISRAYLKSPEDIKEIEKHSHEMLLPERSILGNIERIADVYPDKSAIIQLQSGSGDYRPRTISYKQLVVTIKKAANLFINISGLSPVVAIVLPSVPEYLFAMWGAQDVGVCVPINPFLDKEAVISILNSAGVSVLVTASSEFGPGVWDDVESIQKRVPTLKEILIVRDEPEECEFTLRLKSTPLEAYKEIQKDPEFASVFMPTGGTTGSPKLVKMNQWGQLVVAWNAGALMGADIDSVVAHGMPNFHCGGAIVICLRTIIYGQTLVTIMPEGFRNPEILNNFWNIARKFKITSVLATPTTASALLDQDLSNAKGHSISEFHCGGSTIPLDLIQKFYKKFGIWLRENWGMTEICGTTNGHPGNNVAPVAGSVGCTLPHFQAKVFKVDESNKYIRECDPGERGTLVLSGPSLMLGYLNSSQDADYFIRNVPDGGVWGNTGDEGNIDENGYVWVYGRAKDVIVRGGHNIDAVIIEEALNQHPSVQLAAAVGRPDKKKGELPIAYVMLNKSSTTTTTSDELIDFCRMHITERAAVPVEIIITDNMPLTGVGKVFKPELRIDALSRTATSVVLRILEDPRLFYISIDQSSVRPLVCIVIFISQDKSEPIEAILREEMSGFEFLTDIQFMDSSLA